MPRRTFYCSFEYASSSTGSSPTVLSPGFVSGFRYEFPIKYCAKAVLAAQPPAFVFPEDLHRDVVAFARFLDRHTHTSFRPVSQAVQNKAFRLEHLHCNAPGKECLMLILNPDLFLKCIFRKQARSSRTEACVPYGGRFKKCRASTGQCRSAVGGAAPLKNA